MLLNSNQVGVLTLSEHNNYGAVLQCYGLKRSIEQLGFQCRVLKVSCAKGGKPKFWQNWGIRSGRIIQAAGMKYVQFRYGEAGRVVFDRFRAECLGESVDLSDFIEESAVHTDMSWHLVIGSDQVWNHNISGNSAYYGNIPVQSRIRIVSYAASCGRPYSIGEDGFSLGEYFNNLNDITVRDRFTQDFVSSHRGHIPDTVADPTILQDFQILERKRNAMPEKYILVYCLGSGIEYRYYEFLKEIRRSLRLPIVAIVAAADTPRISPYADQVIYDATPNEWLHLFKNAIYICTDSFHGAIFAVKYRVNFTIILEAGYKSHRINDLGRCLGISSRIISLPTRDSAKAMLERAVSWEEIDRRLLDLAKASVQRLRQLLRV